MAGETGGSSRGCDSDSPLGRGNGGDARNRSIEHAEQRAARFAGGLLVIARPEIHSARDDRHRYVCPRGESVLGMQRRRRIDKFLLQRIICLLVQSLKLGEFCLRGRCIAHGLIQLSQPEVHVGLLRIKFHRFLERV